MKEWGPRATVHTLTGAETLHLAVTGDVSLNTDSPHGEDINIHLISESPEKPAILTVLSPPRSRSYRKCSFQAWGEAAYLTFIYN